MQIKIDKLSYKYLEKTPNEVEALHEVSLEIPEGKITSIIGHTGSGKSTLIQTLNGLYYLLLTFVRLCIILLSQRCAAMAYAHHNL